MNKITITVISDTHLRSLKDLNMRSTDLLIHCGDWTGVGNMEQILLFRRQLEEVSSVFDKVLIVPGNHDFLCEKNPTLVRSFFGGNIVYLQHERYEYEGFKFFLSPYTPKFYDWAFMPRRGEAIKKIWDQIPDDTEILVSHGPPYGVLDKTPDGEHVGCKDLLKRVKDMKPKVHCAGHIHHSSGTIEKYGIRFINAAICDEQYQATNKPYVFSLERRDKEITVEML